MPDFETWVDIDVDDFYFECNDRERKELAEMLIEDNYASPFNGTSIEDNDLSQSVVKILQFRLLLTVEEDMLSKVKRTFVDYLERLEDSNKIDSHLVRKAKDELDIGGNGGNGNWLQSTNRSDLSVNYPLLLNPNGGNVGIGITNPGP